jgi:hypothetical protein
MAPLQPPHNFKFHCFFFFFEIDASNVTSSSNQPPNPIPSDLELLFDVDMWIFV